MSPFGFNWKSPLSGRVCWNRAHLHSYRRRCGFLGKYSPRNLKHYPPVGPCFPFDSGTGRWLSSWGRPCGVSRDFVFFRNLPAGIPGTEIPASSSLPHFVYNRGRDIFPVKSRRRRCHICNRRFQPVYAISGNRPQFLPSGIGIISLLAMPQSRAVRWIATNDIRNNSGSPPNVISDWGENYPLPLDYFCRQFIPTAAVLIFFYF